MMRMISIGGDRAVTARDSQFLGLCQSQYLQPLPKSLSSKVGSISIRSLNHLSCLADCYFFCGTLFLDLKRAPVKKEVD